MKPHFLQEEKWDFSFNDYLLEAGLTDFAKKCKFPLVIARNWKRLHSLAVIL
jgi:hypothetical protein